jgi:hypothetical protein
MKFFQTKLVVEGQQGDYFSNSEVAGQYVARTERPFCQHEANYFTKIIRQALSGPGIVK